MGSRVPSRPWCLVLLLLLALVALPVITPVGAQSGGLKSESAGDAGSLQLFLYDCPPGTDPTTDQSDCLPTEQPWNLWIAPEGSQTIGEERWLLDDAVEIDRGAFHFSDLAPGIWDLSPDQDGPDGPVDVVVTSNATQQGSLWQLEIAPGTETVASVYRMLPHDYAETGSVTVRFMDCASGTDPLADDTNCTLAAEPWAAGLELVGQSDAQQWMIPADAIDQGQGAWHLADLPVATITVLPGDIDGSEVVVGGDAYALGNLQVVDVIGGQNATVVLYRIPA